LTVTHQDATSKGASALPSAATLHLKPQLGAAVTPSFEVTVSGRELYNDVVDYFEGN
jgi:hypothetical protein